MNWKRLLILVIAFILYLVIGALVFSALESAQEEQTRVDLRQYKEAILSNLTCLSKEILEQLIERVVNVVERGVSPLGNVSSGSNWDFSSSFFFSGTVVTTIGYGRHAPSTEGGRVFCILYAIFGIPFLGWLLTIVGEFYRESFWNLTKRLDSALCNYCSLTKRKLRRFVVWFVVASFIYGLLVLIPAAIFTVLEKWDYTIAHYYCFITLTTIGFGDYVATVDPRHQAPEALEIIYDLAVVFWYIFGLSFIAVVISAIGTRERKTAEKIALSLKNRHAKKRDSGSREAQSGERVSYAVDGGEVQLTIEEGIVGPVSYSKAHASENFATDASTERPSGDQNDATPSDPGENQTGVSPEYSFNDNNGNAFNGQSDMLAANDTQGINSDDVQLQNNALPLNDAPDEKTLPLGKRVSFDSSCRPTDGASKIRRKATGKRKGSSKKSTPEVTGEEDEFGANTISTVNMTTAKNCRNFDCHANDIGAI